MYTTDTLLQVGTALRNRNPLVHCITSPIAINDCANALLAIGARPVMAEYPAEAAEITAISQALGVSLANITDARAKSILLSGTAAGLQGLPSVLDAVGVTCSRFRMELAREFLQRCRPTVIKGNASEIRALAGAAFGACGIDTAPEDRVSPGDPEAILALGGVVKELARQTGAVVLATGPVDLLSDGSGLWTSENGSPRLAEITGTGCILNCIIAACLAAERDPVCAVLYAAALLEIAGELAASIPDQRLGLGSFHIRLLDQLSLLTPEDLRSRLRIRALS